MNSLKLFMKFIIFKSEDEALARALSLSLQETTGNNQVEEDRRIAQRLQESDRQGNNPSSANRDRCAVS